MRACRELGARTSACRSKKVANRRRAVIDLSALKASQSLGSHREIEKTM